MIEIEEIAEYIDGHSRPMVESRLILRSGYLQKLGLVKNDDKLVHIRGISLQVSHPSNEPVEINLKISKPFPGYIMYAHCTCTGGTTGKCKHSVAVMRSLTS